MIVVKCRTCGKKILWDDFQPMKISCPNCRADVYVRTSLRQNIQERELKEGRKAHYCPHCEGLVPRRWFARCPHCRYWLFGPASFSGTWPFVLGLAVLYLMFTVYYLLYIH